MRIFIKYFFSKCEQIRSFLKERFESERDNLFTEEINKIALSSNDNKKCNKLIRQKHKYMERGKI